jgi:thiol-disulfide isomerase/thioredoxin
MLTKFSLALFLIFGVFTVFAKAQDFVASVRKSLQNHSSTEAQAKLQQYKQLRGITPEYLEAFSWLGRNSLTQGDYHSALQFADQTYDLCQQQLKQRPLDAEPQLPTALGAAIEVRGQALAKTGKAVQAQQYLRSELQKYRDTSIAVRIQKNINLLGLRGRPAPALAMEHHLGPAARPLAQLRGKPVILFLWAHWCADCKAQAPLLAKLQQEFKDKIYLVGPTQLYGYAGNGMDATQAQELQWIDFVRTKYFPMLADMPVPVSARNFQQYGVSTTPTLVILDKHGKVALYHPGRMTYEELHAQLTSLLQARHEVTTGR